MLQDMHYNQPKIISNRVVREEDGLAMSSRNLYLTTKERDIAPSLYKTLLGISESLLDGDIDFNALTLKAIKNLKKDEVAAKARELFLNPQTPRLEVLMRAKGSKEAVPERAITGVEQFKNRMVGS